MKLNCAEFYSKEPMEEMIIDLVRNNARRHPLGARTHGFVFYRVPFVGRKATPLRVAGFPISMAILGLIETLAILVLVATVVMMPRYESV